MKYYQALKDKLVAKHGTSRTDRHTASGEHSGPAGAASTGSGPSRAFARGGPRKPTKADEGRDRGCSLGFLGPEGAPATASDRLVYWTTGRGTSDITPGPESAGGAWRKMLEGWPQDLKESWDERAAIMEYEGGLDRKSAEESAFCDVALRYSLETTQPNAPDPWAQLEGMLKFHGFREVDPAEIDDRICIPLSALRGIEEADRPQRCENRHCWHKDRWWKSIYGVTNCLNCRPPSFPDLVMETGSAS